MSEGWYGEQYGKPLAKTREYLDIVRTVWKREAPLEHHGEHYDIPYDGPGATGLGKPLKIIVHPRTAEIPMYIASIGPRTSSSRAEIADGWLPDLLLADTRARRLGRRARRAASPRPAASAPPTSTSRRRSPSSSATTSLTCAT